VDLQVEAEVVVEVQAAVLVVPVAEVNYQKKYVEGKHHNWRESAFIPSYLVYFFKNETT
jgi:hypothetical protein